MCSYRHRVTSGVELYRNAMFGFNYLLEAFALPLDWSTELFSTFVRHARLSTLPIYYFVSPRHIRSIVLPPTSSSLINAQSQGLSTRLICPYDNW